MKDIQKTSEAFQRNKIAIGMKERKGFNFWEELQTSNKSHYPPYPTETNSQAVCGLTIKEIL